ncbi:acyl carrier protein phosphodiesterase [Spirosoma areae]
MNILAHAYLSNRHPDLLIGNFIGDFIKGDPAGPRHNLTPGVVAGVRLHRAIDTFTDAHPDVAAVRDLLHPRCHKYAGAAVDIFFDYFLAVDFTRLAGQSLSEFVSFFYQTIRENALHLPPAANRMADYMIRQDWLTNYQFVDGIDRSLKGVARRTAYPSGLETAIEDFKQYYNQIAGHFAYFWPALVEHCQPIRTSLLSTL